MRDQDAAWIVGVSAMALVPLAVVVLGYTGRDDSHITYHVADAMAAGRGVVNYSGALLEQSSSLAYTALLALVSAVLGTMSAANGPVVSLVLHLLAGGVLFAYLRMQRLTAWVAVLAVLLPAPLYWALSGMENSLYLLVLLGQAMVTARFVSRPGARAALPVAAGAVLISLTRPEGALVLVCAGVLHLWLSPRRGALLRLLLVLGAAVAVATVFRLSLGLHVFPNTVYAKQALPLSRRVQQGLGYLVDTARSVPATGLLSFGFLLLALGQRGAGAGGEERDGGEDGAAPGDSLGEFRHALLSLSLAILLFAVAAGGDWMEAGRFLTPVFVFLFLLVALSLRPRRLVWLMGLVMAASVLDIALLARQATGGLPLAYPYEAGVERYKPAWAERFNSIHARDITFVDGVLAVLARDPRPAVTIASIQAGMVPYYIFRNAPNAARFVDLFGLASDEVQPCASQWEADPYADIAALRTCMGVALDYVYDLDNARWDRLRRLRDAGCREVFRESLVIDPAPWKAAFRPNQFLVRCN
ncbi:hypothetical protein [Brevirhabdus sp.]|uniref:hypothetical protein n=1 Tax=Brevirhabdus sp. TaxID=2004514 RepID=UPI004057DD4A